LEKFGGRNYFIDYEGKRVILPPIFEIKAAQNQTTKHHEHAADAIELETGGKSC
jgi:hypothetical protein